MLCNQPRLEDVPLAELGSGQSQTIGPGSLMATRATRPGPGRSVTLRAGPGLLAPGLDNHQVATLDPTGPGGGPAPGPLSRGDQGLPEVLAAPSVRKGAISSLRRGSSQAVVGLDPPTTGSALPLPKTWSGPAGGGPVWRPSLRLPASPTLVVLALILCGAVGGTSALSLDHVGMWSSLNVSTAGWLIPPQGRGHHPEFALPKSSVMSVLIVASLSLIKGPWSDPKVSPDHRASMLVANMTLLEKLAMLHGPETGPCCRETVCRIRI